MILNIGGGGGVKPRIVVTAPTGSDVTVSKGTTILYAPEVSGTWTFNVPEQGDWSATAILGSKTASKTVSVGKVGVYNVSLRYVSATLNDNSWEDIKGVADASEGQNYWAVGDTKQIAINGKLSDGLTLNNYSTYVYIIGFDHNKDVEGTGIAFQGFKTAQTGGKDVALCDSGYDSGKTSGQWFNMNTSGNNSGGWKSSDMRNTTLAYLKSSFTSDLQSVLKQTKIYTDNIGGNLSYADAVSYTMDDMYLLAEFEVFGERYAANTSEQNYQKQYAYYVAGNPKIKYRHNSVTSSAKWWERSPVYGVYNFCYVNTTTTVGDPGNASANISWGIAPAFKVGTTPIFPTLNDNSWSAIAKVAYTSEGANYWSVGDTKEITLNGKLSDGLTLSNYKTWVYILGFDHNEAIEGKGIVFGGFKTAQTGGIDVCLVDSGYDAQHANGQWFNMYNTNSNAGGWRSSLMRSTTLPLVKTALPTELTSNIKTTTIYSDNTGGGNDTASYVTTTQDDIYLLAEFEIFGARTRANSVEQNYQQQYAYYVAGNSKIKYRHSSTGFKATWYERSVIATTTDGFCSVTPSGVADGSACYYAYGFAPAFRVCYTPPQPISNLSEGTIVNFPEFGRTSEFYVVKHNYQSDINGEGRTLLLRKGSYTTSRFDWNANSQTGSALYPNSTVSNLLTNNYYVSAFGDAVKQLISTTNIYYCSEYDETTVGQIAKSVFLLSPYEYGYTQRPSSYISPSLGEYLSVAVTARESYSAAWSRQTFSSADRAYFLGGGSGYITNVTNKINTYDVYPAFTIPSDTLFDSSGNIVLE